MHLKHIVILFSIFLINTPLLAQPDAKIEKKLGSLFNRGKYEKCYKKAVKLNKKHSKSFVPEYYISKVGIHNYSNHDLNENKRYNSLKSAVRYSVKLPETYDDWKRSIQDSLVAYIYSRYNSTKITRSCKNVLKFYTRTYKDTLDFNVYHYSPTQTNETLTYNLSGSKSDSLRWELIKFAEKQDGIRYSYAGEKPETGFDCSGFTKYVYNHIGIELPHNAQKQSELIGKNITLSEAKAGDLVFFGSQNNNRHYIQHTGIVHSVNNGEIKVIHCVSGGVSIDVKQSSWELYWKEKVLFVKTLPILN
ncbi:MAG: C40 family peptidase [Bacteroidota bacterium]